MSTPHTRAHEVCGALQLEFIKVRDNGMWNDYDHLMICHGCGLLHAVRASFISTPMAISFGFEDGSQLSIPVHGCPACMADPSKPIREAWEHGMRREAYNAAAAKIGARLQSPPKPCRLCGAVDVERNLSADGAHQLCAQLSRRGLPTPPLATGVRQ